ncbi:phage tail length tape measure family protein [Parasalinivibrio latis]|uniref:phage tail tape measure C-terminal domain-containing protein n=1 Tax=Parasalinivibrio latis TaxID=2952610 RepID=UPI0030DE74DC
MEKRVTASQRRLTQSSGQASANVANLAAQFQDVAVTAALAQNPLQIALQQGTQISAALGGQGAGGALKQLGGAFASLISPLSIATIGLVALAAKGLQVVDWGRTASAVLGFVADHIETIAPAATAAAGGLALMYAPAILGGLKSLVVGVGAVTKALLANAAAWVLANPATAIIAGLALAGSALVVFRDDITRVLGVDIVGAAKTGANRVVGLYVGAFHSVMLTWERLPGSFSGVMRLTAAVVAKGVERILTFYVAGFNRLIREVNALSESLGHALSIPDIPPLDLVGLLGLEDQKTQVSALAADVGNALKAALSADYLGTFSDSVSSGASLASTKLRRLAQDALSWGKDTDKAATDAGNAFEQAANAIARQTAQTRIAIREQATLNPLVDRLGYAAAKVEARTQLLSAAQQAQLKDTPKLAAEIERLAESYAQAVKAQNTLASATDTDFFRGARAGFAEWADAASQTGRQVKEAITAGLDGATDALTRFVTTGKADFKSLVASMLADLVRLAIARRIIAPLAGSLGLTANANGNVFAGGTVQPFANGGIVDRPTVFPMKNGAGLMGEAGPEAIMPLARDAQGRLGVRNEGGGVNVEVNVINNSSAPVNASPGTARYDQTARRYVVDVVLEDIRRGGPLKHALAGGR